MAQAMARLHADGLSAAQSLSVLGQNLVNQSYMLATNDFFWISGCVCLGVLPLVWLTKKAVSDGSHAGAD
jgi:DHA2 family multidrug resistance protein